MGRIIIMKKSIALIAIGSFLSTSVLPMFTQAETIDSSTQEQQEQTQTSKQATASTSESATTEETSTESTTEATQEQTETSAQEEATSAKEATATGSSDKEILPKTTDSALPAANESIDSWMPDKGLQEDVLAMLIAGGTLPAGSSIADITKDVMAKYSKIDFYIDHPIKDFTGIDYMGTKIKLHRFYFKDTDIYFPSLAPLTPNMGEVALTYDNTNFSDLDDTLAKIDAELKTHPNYSTTLKSIMLGFKNQHFLDISSWYNYEKNDSRVSLFTSNFGFSQNTANVDATIQPDGTIFLDNPLYIFDATGNRISLTDGITASNGGTYDKASNRVIWKNANPYTALTVDWMKDDLTEPGKYQNVSFSGTLTVRVKGAPITVEYVDDAGNSIATEQQITGYFGDDFDATTSAYKLVIPGYTLDSSKLPANATGKLGAQPQKVTYVYTKDPVKAADVTVHYQDDQGNELAKDEILSGNVGDSYTSKEATIAGYTFKEVKGNATGTLTDQAQEVTYIYTKDPVKAADVTVHYQDEQGNELAADEILSGNVGDSYTSKEATISGYTFKEVKGNATGTLTDQAQEVTYVYTKDPVKAADVTVHYQDEQGNTIAKDEILSGNIGDSYTSKEATISGYTFKEVKGNASGTLTDQAQEVTYVYTKDPVKAADVTVHYQDEQGNELAKDEILSGNVGDSYTSKEATISGYTFKEVKGNATGTLTDQAQEVTYIYTKDPVKAADVTVHYQDEQGNELAKDEILTGNVGDSYTSKEATIAGYTFKEVKGNATGTLTDQAQEVTYIYTKDSIDTGKVIVHYQDEQGNKLAEDKVLNGTVGEEYKTEQLTITGDTFKEVKGNKTGLFAEGTQEVTYVYTKDSVKEGEVTVHYEDDQGNTIAKDETISGKVGSTYDTAPHATTDKTLPNTGEDNKVSTALEVMGLVLMMSLVPLNFIMRRKKNKE